MALNLEFGLTPYDPWVLKKNLTESDLATGHALRLPLQEVVDFIIPEIDPVTVQNLGSPNGVEVKVHIIEEGHDADDYTVVLINYNNRFVFKAGWSNIAKAKGYKPGDQIGLMWEKSPDRNSGRFLLHHIK